MLDDFRIVATCCALMVGLLVVSANPARRLNRAFFVFSCFVAAWLFSQWQAGRSDDGLWWVRVACAFAVGVVLMIWFVKETAANPDLALAAYVRKIVPWAIVGLGLIVVCFTEYFIPATSTSERRLYGLGYYAYISVISALVLAIFAQTLFQLRTISGSRRLELQQLLLGSIAAAVAVVIMMILGAVTGNTAFNKAQSVFVLGFYASTSWAIVTSRILDARYLVSVWTEKVIQAIATAAGGFLLFRVLIEIMPDILALFFSVGISLWFAGALAPWLRQAVGLHRSDVDSRATAHEVGRRESRPAQLEQEFVKILQRWAYAENAVILTGRDDSFSGAQTAPKTEAVIPRTMRNLRWATPERLARERPTQEREAVAQFMREHKLGALVIGEGLTLTALVGVGVPANRKPFTYPQVMQLLELASIMESALERAYFSAKAQHSEQLATVGLLGANLAHEIRNPLVSIKTFVQLLPTHHQDPVFREKFFRLIGEEVTRIDQLTEQLLDLATPRTYSASQVELHAVLRSSLDLVAAKAGDKGVEFRTDFRAAPDRVFTDPAAAKQVLLNLCFNAIQAVEARGEGERWIKIATQNAGEGVEMVVSDSGLGIAPEIHPRLFQPFQTTKSSGFGLGLAICRDILANLRASISVDPPVPGQGATFRVTYPCQPSSS